MTEPKKGNKLPTTADIVFKNAKEGTYRIADLIVRNSTKSERLEKSILQEQRKTNELLERIADSLNKGRESVATGLAGVEVRDRNNSNIVDQSNILKRFTSVINGIDNADKGSELVMDFIAPNESLADKFIEMLNTYSSLLEAQLGIVKNSIVVSTRYSDHIDIRIRTNKV